MNVKEWDILLQNMVDEEEIIRVAELMKIDLEEHGEHVSRVKKMLEYFDILDQIDLSSEEITSQQKSLNELRKDEFIPYDKKLIESSEMMQEDMDKYVLGSAIKPDQIDESKAVDIELMPGDISIHNPFLIHGSNFNNSDKWRKTYIIAFRDSETIKKVRSIGFTHSHNDKVDWEKIISI